MAKRNWKEQRFHQGHSYHEVLAEMKRRMAGERVFTKEEARLRFQKGVKKLDRAYRFSARLCDLLESEQLSYEDVLNIAEIPDRMCLLNVLLDPVSSGGRRRSLRNNEEVSVFYPGNEVSIRK